MGRKRGNISEDDSEKYKRCCARRGRKISRDVIDKRLVEREK